MTNTIRVYREDELTQEEEIHEFTYNWCADARTIKGVTYVVFKNRPCDPNTVHTFTNVQFVEINGQVVNLIR